MSVMGKYHSELLMLFNLAFLMKCKYNCITIIHVCIVIGVDLEYKAPMSIYTEFCQINICELLLRC